MYMSVCVCVMCVTVSVQVLYLCLSVCVGRADLHGLNISAPELEPRRPFSSEPQAAERAWDHVPGERGAGGRASVAGRPSERLAAGSFTPQGLVPRQAPTSAQWADFQLPRSLRMERVF